VRPRHPDHDLITIALSTARQAIVRIVCVLFDERSHMRLKASIATLLLLAAVLAGCATAAGRGPSASGSPSTSTGVTPTPESTPSVTADPEDPSTWVVTEHGMGPITLGAPFPEALALMPEGTTNDADNCAWSGWWNAPDEEIGRAHV
jgi:hypothetical protein